MINLFKINVLNCTLYGIQDYAIYPRTSCYTLQILYNKKTKLFNFWMSYTLQLTHHHTNINLKKKLLNNNNKSTNNIFTKTK